MKGYMVRGQVGGVCAFVDRYDLPPELRVGGWAGGHRVCCGTDVTVLCGNI